MAENYFLDYPQRIEALQNAGLKDLIIPLEDTFGEKGFYKSTEEAMEMFTGALAEIGKFCAQEIRPTAEAIDREGAKFKDGVVTLPTSLTNHLKRLAELGVFSGPIAKKYGGINFPRVLQAAIFDMIGQACPNTGLTAAVFSMSDFLIHFGTEEQINTYVPKFLTNELHSSMALTEPNAGSDLGRLRTSAKKNGDHWIINGTKIFITNGNSDVSFALVRTDPASQGLAGLSVMIVPKVIDGKENFKVAKIEDKVCLHASPTCELLFENSIGYLMGPEGQGFKVMSQLMNSARLAMSALSLGIATGAWADAKKYAATRMTMGKPISQHPMVADILHEMEIELRAMRALIYEAGVAYDWMELAEVNGNKKEHARWKKRFRRLTPLCKYYCSEKAVQITRQAVQIFGGYGVCRDYPVERYYRESVIYPIYEGTSQIQSLMVLKDTLKDVAQQSTGFLGSLAGAWAESKLTTDPVKSKVLAARNELNQGIKTILGGIIKSKFKSDIESLKQTKIQEFLKEFSLSLLTPKTDLTFPFLVAERFCRITCDYYALKSMADHHTPGNKQTEKWIMEFAALAIPRMQLENHYMVHRLPSTLDTIGTIGTT